MVEKKPFFAGLGLFHNLWNRNWFFKNVNVGPSAPAPPPHFKNKYDALIVLIKVILVII